MTGIDRNERRRPVRRGRGVVVLLIAGGVALTGCSPTLPESAASPPSPSPTAATSGPGYPGADWATVKPSAARLDPKVLRRMAAAEKAVGDSTCLLVVRHGKIAGEWYFNGATEQSRQDVFSVTKSVTSTLVGIAQDEGRLQITQPADRFLPAWAGTRSADVTVRDLLSNDSGRRWSVRQDYDTMIKAQDRSGFAVGVGQQQRPGTVWAYNNTAIQTLEPILAKATGTSVSGFAQNRLFTPTGMSSSNLTTDGAGNPQTFSGLTTTCRDLARFGLLMLRDGAWNGRQVVSRAWVREATGRSSSTLNAAYGYLWWLNRKGSVGTFLEPTTAAEAKAATPRRLVPGAPADTFWAIGLGGQIVQVDRGSDTVVVRLGKVGLDPNQASATARTAKVLDAVEK